MVKSDIKPHVQALYDKIDRAFDSQLAITLYLERDFGENITAKDIASLAELMSYPCMEDWTLLPLYAGPRGELKICFLVVGQSTVDAWEEYLRVHVENKLISYAMREVLLSLKTRMEKVTGEKLSDVPKVNDGSV